MALRLRRGTDAQRGTITPAEGELIYTTDTKKIYAGDGSSVGGNIVSGINNVLEDVTPQLGGTLDTNSQNILIDETSLETNVIVGSFYENFGQFESLQEIQKYWSSSIAGGLLINALVPEYNVDDLIKTYNGSDLLRLKITKDILNYDHNRNVIDNIINNPFLSSSNF